MKESVARTDTLIDVGKSLKESATKAEAAFPYKNPFKEISLKALYSTKIEAVFMKGSSDLVAAFTSQSSDSMVAGRFRRFRAYVEFGTGAKEIDELSVEKKLRQHFENCGGIEGISVDYQAEYAYIDFTSLESLLKALQQDKTSFCGSPLYIQREITNNFTFRAAITGLDIGARELDVLPYFKFCGEIEGIRVRESQGAAYIDFASLAGLDEALELDKTLVGDRLVDVDEVRTSTRRFLAEIRGFDTGAGAEEALREHFKKCGRIEGMLTLILQTETPFSKLWNLMKLELVTILFPSVNQEVTTVLQNSSQRSDGPVIWI